jgi:2-oxoglutarate dehydrogenase complex dehydrogenase (E1) component-like enzyme
MVNAYRSRGHLEAELDPLAWSSASRIPSSTAGHLRLHTERDMERTSPAA